MLYLRDTFIEYFFTMNLNVFFPPQLFITIIAGVLFLNKIEHTRSGYLRKLSEIIIFSLGSVPVLWLLATVFDYYHWDLIYVERITIIVLLVIYALFFSKLLNYNKFQIICIIYSASMLMESIRLILLDNPSFNNLSTVIQYVVFISVYLFILTITGIPIKKFSVDITDSDTPLKVIVFLITLFCYSTWYMIKIRFSLITYSSVLWNNIFLYGVLYDLTLVVYLIFYGFTSSHSKRQELAILRQKESDTAMEIARVNKLNDEMRVLRHEFKNHVLSMRILLETRQYDKLDNYLENYLKADVKALNYIDCGNNVLNNIFNFKLVDLKAKGVLFDARGSVPETLPYDENDITSLLVNLIDNAAEASLKTTNPSVSVKVMAEKGFCFITVVNPVHNDVLIENPMLQTTKNDKNLHGIGLRVVKRIISKYDGHINFEQKDKEFIASVMLSLG